MGNQCSGNPEHSTRRHGRGRHRKQQKFPMIPLSNGVEIPQIGFGTWRLETNTKPLVLHALQHGYQHIDTAVWYQNQADIGEALAQLKVTKGAKAQRQKLWITTKIPPECFAPEDVRTTFDQCLAELGVDYVDALLLHTPGEDDAWKQAWQVLEEIYETGKTRCIGVSNFDTFLLQDLLGICKHAPHIVQNYFARLSKTKQW
eukprot:TRINITY_DN68062_c5_g13_i1.p1 TRINITY_DN68062_c5_g13~~TRINITY_DN68062_c5_g13_i1.p1  ORF type:complete len:202 (+),score=14.76 TRINITY_DN68062_c5_g13_i1:83-688(+)